MRRRLSQMKDSFMNALYAYAIDEKTEGDPDEYSIVFIQNIRDSADLLLAALKQEFPEPNPGRAIPFRRAPRGEKTQI